MANSRHGSGYGSAGLSKQPWAGSKKTLLVGYLTLPCRGICFAMSNDIWTLLWFQCLDGVAAGAFGVLSVLIMSDLTQGTGRFSMMQGGLATGIGIGASASHGIGGAWGPRMQSAIFTGAGCVCVREGCVGTLCGRGCLPLLGLAARALCRAPPSPT